jgi:hypothetical protein
MAIIGNHFGACGHGFLIKINGTTASCGHCHEVVYPDLLVLRNHTFACEGGICVWYSRDLQVTVHRCDQPTTSTRTDFTADINITSLV